MDSDVSKELQLVYEGRRATFAFTTSTLSIKRETKTTLQVPLKQVIWAQYDEEAVEIHFLARGSKKGALSLVKAEGKVFAEGIDLAGEWTATLMDRAYEGVKRSRRLKVLINPHSGQGQAASLFRKRVQPIFRAARCQVDVTYTKYAKHAFEIVRDLQLDYYDVLVTISGDGLVHEVINGLAAHKLPLKALNTPVAPVPTGSGNGLALNLLGLQDGFDVVAAALNIIKGRPMNADLFAITQNGQRYLSFFSQAVGLMADLDLGTEKLRWMGDARFVIGFLRGIVYHRPCPITLSIKAAADDKMKILEAWQATRAATITTDQPVPQMNGDSNPSEAVSLPPLKYTKTDNEGWTTFDRPLLYVYAGQGPYVGRDFMQFPVSLPDDGMIDVVAQEITTRRDMFTAMDSADKGGTYWLDTQHYFKAHAYRITPHSPRGCLSIDGEAYPFTEFQVEVHPKLATLISLYGHYVADFKLRQN